MKLCPACQREVADDASVCECGLRFDEMAAPVSDGARQEPPASEPQKAPDSKESDAGVPPHEEADLDESALDAEGGLVEADLDIGSTAELVVAEEETEPEPPSFRRAAPAPKKKTHIALIIGAHAVIILAAITIFWYKQMRSASSTIEYRADDSAASYVTHPNTAARRVEDTLRKLSLSSDIVEIEKESPASPEATVVVRLNRSYPSMKDLKDAAETDAVLIWNAIMKTEERVKTVYVEVEASFSNGSPPENALVVTFERGEKKDLLKGLKRPHEILSVFEAEYNPLLESK